MIIYNVHLSLNEATPHTVRRPQLLVVLGYPLPAFTYLCRIYLGWVVRLVKGHRAGRMTAPSRSLQNMKVIVKARL